MTESGFKHLPWRDHGTAMMPQTLLVAKMMFVMLCIERVDHYFHDPFLPFVPALGWLGHVPGYGWLLKITFMAAGLLLMTNRHVRPASIILGLVVLLANLQSQVEFRNHTTLCGAVLLLAGLQPRGQEPWLIRWQIVVVYLGAWLNKQTDPDWLSGRFFEYWTHCNLRHPIYMKLAEALPQGWLSILLSWTTMASEFLVMLGLCFRRWRTKALWLGILFHLATFVFTYGSTFGHFVQTLGVAYLAFLNWPATPLRVRVPAGWRGMLLSLVRASDANKTCEWSTEPGDGKLSACRGNKVHGGFTALAEILRYHTGFYWSLLLLFEFCVHVLPWPQRFSITSLLIGCGMFPFACAALRPNPAEDPASGDQ